MSGCLCRSILLCLGGFVCCVFITVEIYVERKQERSFILGILYSALCSLKANSKVAV